MLVFLFIYFSTLSAQYKWWLIYTCLQRSVNQTIRPSVQSELSIRAVNDQVKRNEKFANWSSSCLGAIRICTRRTLHRIVFWNDSWWHYVIKLDSRLDLVDSWLHGNFFSAPNICSHSTRLALRSNWND